MRSSSGFRIKLTYDEYNRASDVKFEYGSTDLTTSWVFGKSSTVYGVKYNGTEKLSYAYDSLMRRTKTAINTTTPFVTNYSYKDIDLDRTTTQLSSISYSNGKAFKYTYDANGNVLDIKDQNDNLLVSYDYDALNQLTRENNAQLNKTITYTYDNGGNILSVKEYAFTTGDLDDLISEKTYTYGNSEWKDLLTNYNGINITYDTIGNPEKWINGEEFDWTGGRQLSGITKGSNVISYTYNDDGIRTSKTVNGVKTDFYLNGTTVIMQKTGDNCIWYTYDENGLLTGFRYNGNEYYYFKNIQGDIIGIIDSSGAVVARYTYDAWGNHIAIRDGSGNDVSNNASHIANINPFRYRGYYFDIETGLYYVSSRYYDSKIGRWINADSVVAGVGGDILGYNMFAYYNQNQLNLTSYDVSFSEQTFRLCKSANQDFFIPKNPTPDSIVYYDVPLYNQNGYSLCWAFCQVMVEDYQAGRTRTNEQATERAISISRSVNGDDWNQGGWPTNSRDLFGDTGINSLNDLYSALVKNGPIYAYYGGTDGAHLVVITGVNKTKGIIYTNNPWGIAGEQTYNQFLYGFVGMPIDWDMPFGFYIFTQ